VAQSTNERASAGGMSKQRVVACISLRVAALLIALVAVTTTAHRKLSKGSNEQDDALRAGDES
jgi:hypothetical protein